MASILPDLPPSISFICIIAILIVYVVCCYMVIDFISQDDEIVLQDSYTVSDQSSSFSHLSVEELQEITRLHFKVGPTFSICAICLENMQHADVCRFFPACLHEFHAECIDPWLSKRLTCPTCRTPLFAVEEHSFKSDF